MELAEKIRDDLATILDAFYDRPDLANEARQVDNSTYLEMYLNWLHEEADTFFDEEE